MTPSDYAIVAASGKLGKGYPITESQYDAHGNLEYFGIAPRGSLTSQPCWIIEKFTYADIPSDLSASPNYMVTKSRVSPDNSIFDNYATLTYS